MKKLISVLILVAIMASFCTVSAFAATGELPDETGAVASFVEEGATKYFDTLQNAINAAGTDATITLLADITITAPLSIKKGITITSDNKTITYTGSDTRAVTIDTTGKVTLSNLKIVSNAERGIQVQSGVNVELNKVTVSAYNYAINLNALSVGSALTIIGGSYSGLNVINIWSNAAVYINGATILTVDNNPSESYANIKLNNYGTYSAAGAIITLENATLSYTGTGVGSEADSVSIGTNETVEQVLTLKGTNSFDIMPVGRLMEAVINYDSGYSSSFSKFANALASAKDGETILAMRDIDLGDETIEINKNITIDMNGNKVTNGTLKAAEGVTITVENWTGTQADLDLLLGKQPPANPYGVPATADNSNMPLWSALFIAFAAVALLTGKKRRA